MGFTPFNPSCELEDELNTVTTLTTENEGGTTTIGEKPPLAIPVRRSPGEGGWARIRPVLLAIAFPLVLLAVWHFATVNRSASLIPPPYDVWQELEDLAVGGINDDAY